MKLKTPPFRPSSILERKEFYKKEFFIKDVKKWFKENSLPYPQIFAIDPGSETKIMVDKKYSNTLLYFPAIELEAKIRKYCPEDLYYDRSTYDNPKQVLRRMNFRGYLSQILMFDLDFDNVTNQPLSASALNKVLKKSKELKKVLKRIGFRKIKIIYSGRGFHVYVFDQKAQKMSYKERKIIAKKFSSFPIDPWVTNGYIRLARLPYSLNAIVSRKVVPTRNYKTKSIPKFLK